MLYFKDLNYICINFIFILLMILFSLQYHNSCILMTFWLYAHQKYHPEMKNMLIIEEVYSSYLIYKWHFFT